MRKIKRTVEINAPVDKVFAFVTDPNNLPSFYTNLIEVSNVQRRPDGGSEFAWAFKMAGIKFHGQSKTVMIKKNIFEESRTEGGIPSTFKWTYVRPLARTTRLTVEVEYDIPTPVLGKVVEVVAAKMNEHDLERMLSNLKIMMEGGARTEASPTARAH